MSDPADAKEYAEPRVRAAGLHWPTIDRQVDKESGWRHWSSPGVVKSSPTGSKGLMQLNSRFYGPELWENPYRNMDKGISLMQGYVARFGSYRLALAAYNWGPSNVSGYTDEERRVHPAWDGTREWRCPHEDEVAQCRTAQRDRYLDAILGPGWPEPGVAPASPAPGGTVLYEDFRAQPAGTFARTPKGIILHGSRSGAPNNPIDQEYLGTARYCVNNPGGLAWSATIGEGKVAVHLRPNEWGWNARGASDDYLAVEFAQPTAAHPITDGQVASFVDWVKTRVLATWPQLPMHLPTHAELDGSAEYGGTIDGKSDVHPRGDSRADQLRARIMAALGKGGVVEEPTTFAVGPGILEAMRARGEQPACDEVYVKAGDRDAYSEAFSTAGARYVWIPGAGRVVRYDPAA